MSVDLPKPETTAEVYLALILAELQAARQEAKKGSSSGRKR